MRALVEPRFRLAAVGIRLNHETRNRQGMIVAWPLLERRALDLALGGSAYFSESCQLRLMARCHLDDGKYQYDISYGLHSFSCNGLEYRSNSLLEVCIHIFG